MPEVAGLWPVDDLDYRQVAGQIPDVVHS